MKIIGGKLSGIHFKSPKGNKIHPMSNKIRGALFSMLGDLDGLTVLDAYAGSGAISFEAISRGAKSVQALEIDKSAYKIINQNIATLRLSNSVKCTRANNISWVKNNQSSRFNVIIADPPYDKTNGNNLTIISNLLNDNGVFVLSYPGKNKLPEIAKLKIIHSKNYGDATLGFYKH